MEQKKINNMETKYKYWKSVYPPREPSAPILQNETHKTVQLSIGYFGGYVDVPFEELHNVRNAWCKNITKEMLDVSFCCCAETDDDSASLVVYVNYKLPLTEVESENIKKRNSEKQKEYDKNLELYNLQMQDYKIIKKEEDAIKENKEYQQFLALKEKFKNK